VLTCGSCCGLFAGEGGLDRDDPKADLQGDHRVVRLNTQTWQHRLHQTIETT
jgi:hypothetical protein